MSLTPLETWTLAALALALIPTLLYLLNRAAFRPPRLSAKGESRLPLSVLIPARDEEASIAAAVESVLDSEDLDLEVIVLDDHSRDRTREIVEALADRDPRVSVHTAPSLPSGWCGKQHACHVLAGLARHPLLAFIDADVRVEPSGLARMVDTLERRGVDLLSGFPRQITSSLAEKMLLPLMHFLALGFLPIPWMRRSRHPAFGAGCGQLFVSRRDAYFRAGGHAAIRASLHDGVTLPRAYRRAGLRTDLVDATDVARCRMYRGAAEVWTGLAKNATEGLAHPAAIVPWTTILLGGQVLPLVLLGAALSGIVDASPRALLLATAASLLAWLPRTLAAGAFRQSRLGALLHPIGVLLLLAIQWQALWRSLRGRPSTWKGRDYRAAIRPESASAT